jgi:hypothetical protein
MFHDPGERSGFFCLIDWELTKIPNVVSFGTDDGFDR